VRNWSIIAAVTMQSVAKIVLGRLVVVRSLIILVMLLRVKIVIKIMRIIMME
jgi:hypothetical protein